MFKADQQLIDVFMNGAKRLGLVQGMAGGEKRGYMSPDFRFIDLAGYKSHDYLAKTLGFSGSKEVIGAGLVRVANTDYDMEYEFAEGNDECSSNINASISWNIGMETWPRNAQIFIIEGDKRCQFTAKDFVEAKGGVMELIKGRQA